MNEIWLGDSEELARDLPNNIACVVTDPPYGMNYQSNRATTPEGREFTKKIANDEDLDGALTKFSAVMEHIVPKMTGNSDMYVFTRWDLMQPWKNCIEALGLLVNNQLIWAKGYPGMGDLTYNWGTGYEVILYAKKGKRPVHHRRSGIISVDNVLPGIRLHPTEKPVQLMEELIAMSTEPGELVVDPFSGSGASSVAAQKLGRRSIGIEIDNDYYIRSLERLSTPAFDLWGE